MIQFAIATHAHPSIWSQTSGMEIFMLIAGAVLTLGVFIYFVILIASKHGQTGDDDAES